jgi:ADP-heptose:LPS heptosyltransferase
MPRRAGTAVKRDRTATLKQIDHWLGFPLCVALGALGRMLRPFRGATTVPADLTPRRIVISKFFGLGSILLSSALARALRARYPDAELVYLTFDANRDLLRRLGVCDEVKTITLRTPWAFVTSVLQFVAWCARRPPDVFVDLEFYSKFSTLIGVASRARWRAGFYLPQFWRTSLVNVPVHFNLSRHILEIYGMVGAAVGAPVGDALPSRIAVSDADRHALAEQFPGLRPAVLVGVNVNASDLALCRRWPRERFAAVIDGLLRWREDIVVVLTGSGDEAPYTRETIPLLREPASERVVDVSGKLSFGAYLALLDRFDVLLTNDSGPFHLAKANGLPTVSIWGPGSPSLYGPYGAETKAHVALHKQWPCSPCLYIYRTNAGHFCGGTTPCMDAIGSDEVLRAVQAVITTRAQPRTAS